MLYESVWFATSPRVDAILFENNVIESKINNENNV